MKWRTAILRCELFNRNREEQETAMQVLREMVEEDVGGEWVDARFVAPDVMEIAAALYEMIDYEQVDLLFTIGGAGAGPDDVVPEATMQVIERTLPGMAETMRMMMVQRDAKGMLYRGIAGMKNRALVINLPGEPISIMETMQALIPAIKSLLDLWHGDQAN
jgi:molybdenum cofactor synthesis domain-containing protein